MKIFVSFLISSLLINKQMIERTGGGKSRVKYGVDHSNRTYKINGVDTLMAGTQTKSEYDANLKNPSTIIYFDTGRRQDLIHPTQKPVTLFEYLIKTYSNEGETILDNCMGSGTTAIAAINTNRNYIGFELDKEYYEKSLERIQNHKTPLGIEW